MNKLHITECPRDAMQGWHHHIATDTKIGYLQQLMRVGYEVLDCGSFVSPKAIPQMADTAQVLDAVAQTETKSKLLAIVANERGATEAVKYAQISLLGYPFSISETFQQRNSNKSIAESLLDLQKVADLAAANNKEIMLYISMGFGNPYGDEYSAELALKYAHKMAEMGIRHIAMSDTVGVAVPETIHYIFSELIPALPQVTFGAHFHSTAQLAEEKLQAAFDSGCRHFDTSIRGIGGCPMAKDDLVGNIATETLLSWARQQAIHYDLNQLELDKAIAMSGQVFV